jgi:hypothetical protein
LLYHGRRADGCEDAEQEAAADSTSPPPTWGVGMRRSIAGGLDLLTDSTWPGTKHGGPVGPSGRPGPVK